MLTLTKRCLIAIQFKHRINTSHFQRFYLACSMFETTTSNSENVCFLLDEFNIKKGVLVKNFLV